MQVWVKTEDVRSGNLSDNTERSVHDGMDELGSNSIWFSGSR
jgi:hypothetical protein